MNDIKKILVPTDFSQDTVRVLETAATIARKFGASIHLAFVVESLDAYAGFAVPHPSLSKLEQDLLERAGRKMEEFAAAHASKEIPCVTTILHGKVPEQIVRHAAMEGIDLIVIGTRTCKEVQRALFGSVTERVVRTASCPVLTMNPCSQE
ncbi:MAG: universal stress protein [Thermodesulfobacteriota bacterium]